MFERENVTVGEKESIVVVWYSGVFFFFSMWINCHSHTSLVTPTLDSFKKWGVSTIHVLSVIASRKGLSELLKHHPDVHVTIGHVDEVLNDDGDLVPGLGDAGDRLFGTTHPTILEEDEEKDQELVHFSKRKRTMSVDAEK